MSQAGPVIPNANAARLRPSRRWAPTLAAAGLLLASWPLLAQTTAAGAAHPKPSATAAKTAKPAKPAMQARAARRGAAAKPAGTHPPLSSEAKGLALASATTETISDNQLGIAARVLTGQADCEFKQTVMVLALPGKPGLFTVEHKGKRFVMAPRETSTGAVRLEDAAAGVVWLQIPAKSMLMNARIGQRMVDACQHSEQRAATLAVAGAAQSLGIEVKVAAATPPTSPAAAAPVTAEAAAPVVDTAATATVAAPTLALPAATAASAAAMAVAPLVQTVAPAAMPASAPAPAPAPAVAEPAAPAASR